MQKFVILDRDGVINYDSDEFIKSPNEWIPIPGSLDAIQKLNAAGFSVIVASNQSGVGRKLFTLDTLNAIHQKMLDAVKSVGGKIEKIYFCPHAPEEKCDCRKPNTGLFLQIAEDYKIDFTNTYCIGDSFRDIEVGLTMGAKCILVKTGKGEHTIKAHPIPKNVVIRNDLEEAVDFILEVTSKS